MMQWTRMSPTAVPWPRLCVECGSFVLTPSYPKVRFHYSSPGLGETSARLAFAFELFPSSHKKSEAMGNSRCKAVMVAMNPSPSLGGEIPTVLEKHSLAPSCALYGREGLVGRIVPGLNEVTFHVGTIRNVSRGTGGGHHC